MRLNIRLFFFILILIIFSSRSLVIAQVKPVKIGEKAPDFVFRNMLNYPDKTSRIGDFKGKLLILDFWSTRCSVCIQLFPKLSALQQRFKDSIMIIAVGMDDPLYPGDIQRFVEKRAGGPKAVPLPVAIIDSKRDSIFRQWYPNYGLPHEIWIDSSGIVIGITSHFEVNEENISRVLQGQAVKMREKKLVSFVFDKYYLVDGNGGEADNFNSRSLFTSYNDRFPSWRQISTMNSGRVRIFYGNETLQDLYKWAYKGLHPQLQNYLEYDHLCKRLLYYPSDSFLLTTWNDVESLSNADRERFIRNNLHCYELVLPPGKTYKDAYKKMISDLDEYFDITSSLEKVKIKGLALVVIEGVTIPHSKGAQLKGSVVKEEDRIQLFHKDLDRLVRFLNSKYRKIPLIQNLTGISYPVDVDLERPSKNVDIEGLRDKLRTIGLDLIDSEFETEMIILKNRSVETDRHNLP